MEVYNLDDLDIAAIAGLLEESGSASSGISRRALCRKIGVNPNQLDFVGDQVAASDFSQLLVSHLNETKNAQAISKLCQEIETKFKNSPDDIQEIQRIFEKLGISSNRSKLWGSPQRKQSLIIISFLNISITLLSLAIRHVGIGGSWELQAYDTLMRLRPAESKDEFVSVVGITSADLSEMPEKKDKDKTSKDLSDQISNDKLVALLKKLEIYKPTIIGLDIFRDQSEQPDHSNLVNYLKNNPRIVATCARFSSSISPGLKPPDYNFPENQRLPNDQLGFNSSIHDVGDVVRRHLLTLDLISNHPCRTAISLGLQLGLRYLQELKIIAQPSNEGNQIYLKIQPKSLWKLPTNFEKNKGVNPSDTRLKELGVYAGGYQPRPSGGYQVMLNYRSSDSKMPVIPILTMTQILGGNFDRSDIQDRVIIIGYTEKKESENPDVHNTPYGSSPNEKMPGVIIQAHGVSQILNAVLKGRSLIATPPLWSEFIWIAFWCMTESIVVLKSPKPWIVLIIEIGIVFVILPGFCLAFLCLGNWMPFIPSVIALITIGLGSRSINYFLNPE